jgi:hypothetical protein
MGGLTQEIERQGKPASDSAAFFEAAINKEAESYRALKASLDPVFAAQQRLEAQAETIARAAAAVVCPLKSGPP